MVTPFLDRRLAASDGGVLNILSLRTWPIARDANADVNEDTTVGFYAYPSQYSNGPKSSGVFYQHITNYHPSDENFLIAEARDATRRWTRATTNGSWAGIAWEEVQAGGNGGSASILTLEDASKTYTQDEAKALHGKMVISEGSAATTINLPALGSADKAVITVFNGKDNNEDVQVIGARFGTSATDTATLSNTGNGIMAIWDSPVWRFNSVRASGITGASTDGDGETFAGLTDTFNSLLGRRGQFLLVDDDENTIGSVSTIPVAALPNDIPASKITGMTEGSDIEIVSLANTTLTADEAKALNGKFVWYTGEVSGRINLPTTGMTSGDTADFVVLNLSANSSPFSVADGSTSYELEDRRTGLSVSWTGTIWEWTVILSPHTHYFFQLFDTPGNINENDMLLGTAFESIETQAPGTMADLNQADPEGKPRHWPPHILSNFIFDKVLGQHEERVSNPQGRLVARINNATSNRSLWTLGADPKIRDFYKLAQSDQYIDTGHRRRSPEVIGFWFVARMNGVVTGEVLAPIGPYGQFDDSRLNFTETVYCDIRFTFHDFITLVTTTAPGNDGNAYEVEVYEAISPASGSGKETIYARYKSRNLPQELYPSNHWPYRTAGVFNQEAYQKLTFTGDKTYFKASDGDNLVIKPVVPEAGGHRPLMNADFTLPGTELYFNQLVIRDSGANQSIANLFMSSAMSTLDGSAGANMSGRFPTHGVLRVTWGSRKIDISFEGRDLTEPYTVTPQTTEQRDKIIAFLDAVDASNQTTMTFTLEFILEYIDGFAWSPNIPPENEDAPNLFTAERDVIGTPGAGTEIEAEWYPPAHIGSDSFQDEVLYARYRGDVLPERFKPVNELLYLQDDWLNTQELRFTNFPAQQVSKGTDTLVMDSVTEAQRHRLEAGSIVGDADVWLHRVELNLEAGRRQIKVQVARDQVERQTAAGPDFTDEFEQRGVVILRNGDKEFSFELKGRDLTEPYEIHESDTVKGQEMLDFYHAANDGLAVQVIFSLQYDDNFEWMREKPSLITERPYGYEVRRRHPNALAPGDPVDTPWRDPIATSSLGGITGAYVDVIPDYSRNLVLDTGDGITEIHDESGDYIAWPDSVDTMKVTISDIDYTSQFELATKWQYLDPQTEVWRDLHSPGRVTTIILHERSEYSYRFSREGFEESGKLKLRLRSVAHDGTEQEIIHTRGTFTFTVNYQSEEEAHFTRWQKVTSAHHTVSEATSTLLAEGPDDNTGLTSHSIPWLEVAIDPVVELTRVRDVNFNIQNNVDNPETISRTMPGEYLSNVLDFNPAQTYPGPNATTTLNLMLLWGVTEDGVKGEVFRFTKRFLMDRWNDNDPILVIAPLSDGLYLTGFKFVCWGRDQSILNIWIDMHI